MHYKVVVIAEAEEDLNRFIQYLLFAKQNKHAAKNVLDDFEIGRASVGKECVRRCRSRWSPYH